MCPIRVISYLAAACVPFALALSAEAQSGKPPTISNRYFNAGGSVKVTVKGSFQVEAEIPINKTASFGDGEMTWLQYGVSGAEEPNLLITFHPEEIGITVGRGKRIATVGTENCKGKVEVSATVVSGKYTCPGITSHDPSARGLGKVDIEIQFTAKS